MGRPEAYFFWKSAPRARGTFQKTALNVLKKFDENFQKNDESKKPATIFQNSQKKETHGTFLEKK